MTKKYLSVFALLVVFVTGAYAQCVAKFSYSVNGLFQYGFIDLSTPFGDNSITYQWNFGDGGTSTLENPGHTFDSLGTYIVCLTMHSPTLNCSSTYCDTIVIACPAVAGYTFTRGDNYSYDFNYASSSNATVTWLWNFGDGTTATTRNPAHTFPATGVYHVCLTVTDVNIHCTDTYCSDISVCTAQADFSHTNSTRFNYSFTDISFGEDASTTWSWNFGDGDSSNVQNPSHTFTNPGTYNVCLTIDVHDSGCSNQFCTLISVACLDSANFSSANIGGLTFQFTDLSTGEDNTVTYSWSFGDGTASADKNPVHLFNQAGVHDVCLTIRNVDQGCTNTYCGTVTIACNDSAGFSYTNSGNNYHFSDASLGEDATARFLWNFGDGSTSTAKNPAHTFITLGTRQVCLTMTDSDVSCSSQFCENVDVTCPLSTTFTYSSSDSAISFIDGTGGEDASATYEWVFGDGDSSSLKNPVHIYTASGSYHVCLTVSDVDLTCSGQYCQDILINTSGCPDMAAFTYASAGDSFNFQDASRNVGSSATYLWNFGDGDSSVLKNATHTYASTGTYNVCFIVTDASNSCSTDTCQNINVVSGITQINAGVNAIKLYPNPAAGFVNIDLNGFEARTVMIFNQLGEIVKQLIPDSNRLTTIDITTLPAGIYLVSARSDNEVYCNTLVVAGK